MGGNPEHPSRIVTPVSIYSDKIEVGALGLQIPYSSMTNIENMDEQKISALRVIGFGIIGALWKKKHSYTVIQYRDGSDDVTIVLDFRDNIDSAQPLIYGRMLSFRSFGRRISSGDFFTYTNNKYGIRMRYPFHWIKDELWENSVDNDYVTLVEFREVIKEEHPFVTLFINLLGDNNISVKEFIDKEVKMSSLESIDTNTIQLTETQIGGNPAHQMFYMEAKKAERPEDIIKYMVIWTKTDDKIYEITYCAESYRFTKYLPLVEKMLQSFEFIKSGDMTTENADQEQQTSSTEEQRIGDLEDPLLILKRRFALGEITEQEYQRMRKILEG